MKRGEFFHCYDLGFLLLFQWKQTAPTLARWAIGQTLMINQLIDMEWKFGGNWLEAVPGHLRDVSCGCRGFETASMGKGVPGPQSRLGPAAASPSCCPRSAAVSIHSPP